MAATYPSGEPERADRPSRPELSTAAAPARRSRLPWIIGGAIAVIAAAVILYFVLYSGGGSSGGSGGGTGGGGYFLFVFSADQVRRMVRRLGKR
jgi:hypothetical protein